MNKIYLIDTFLYDLNQLWYSLTISSSHPGSCRPNWLHGNAAISSPIAYFFALHFLANKHALHLYRDMPQEVVLIVCSSIQYSRIVKQH